MRTHAEIIGKQITAFGRAIGADPNLVNQWRRAANGQGSIPAPYWASIADRGLATLEELAEAAASRRPDERAA